MAYRSLSQCKSLVSHDLDRATHSDLVTRTDDEDEEEAAMESLDSGGDSEAEEEA